jgi:hypothetical protein
MLGQVLVLIMHHLADWIQVQRVLSQLHLYCVNTEHNCMNSVTKTQGSYFKSSHIEARR